MNARLFRNTVNILEHFARPGRAALLVGPTLLCLMAVLSTPTLAGITVGGDPYQVGPGDPSTWTSVTNAYIGWAIDQTGMLAVDGSALLSGRVSIGDNAGSSGAVTVTGFGSTWTNSSAMVVGYYGAGTLRIENGGQVSHAYSSLGDQYGSSGTTTVTGTGSAWTGGPLYVGRTGSGTLTIENGGQVSTSGTIYVYYSSIIGHDQYSTGTATITGAGSSWVNSAGLVVGYGGPGTLVISNGGQVTNGGGVVVGYQASGTATVSGAGSIWNAANGITVGRSGPGTLVVENGGQVSSSSGIVGSKVWTSGTATVTGKGSIWSTKSALSVGSEYGNGGGTGTLRIENGGQVRSTRTDIWAYIGNAFGQSPSSTVLVKGVGSVWDNQCPLAVRNGTLRIEDGGQVTNMDAAVGFSSGSAQITVTGDGSTWTNRGGLTVGRPEGNGTLLVADGGTVSSIWTEIGYWTGSSTVTVTGAGSSLGSAFLRLGCYGTGTLTIADGGKVTAQNPSIGYTSCVNLHVSGSDMLVLGDAGTVGGLTNNGKINLYADAFLSPGTYKPIAEFAGRSMTWTGSGSTNAFGGTWDSDAKTFTVAAATTMGVGTLGAVQDGERLVITPPGSSKKVGASFGDVPDGTTFSAALMTGNELGGLTLALADQGSVLSAWNFDTNLTGGEVRLSFDIGLGATDLRVWHYDHNDALWTPFDAKDLTYLDGVVSFTVDGFSGYGVTGNGIPEPATLSLLALGGLAVLRRRTRR